MVALSLSCLSIIGAIVIILSWAFIGLRTDSRKFFIILSVTNLVTSLLSLPTLLIILFGNIQWQRIIHVVQVIMILNQYFATSSFLWTTIINLHLYCFVKYGREALKWNKFFHVLVWMVALLSTIPIILGICVHTDFPMFVPSKDNSILIDRDVNDNFQIEATITTHQLVQQLRRISLIMQLLTFGALLLWFANILSTILINVALKQFFKQHYLEDNELKKEFGIDTSLTTVSQLLILAQIPGLAFASWLYFQTDVWQNPIAIQSSFTFGASLQGLLNSIYYLAKRNVRLRFWVFIKKLPTLCKSNNETDSLIHK